MHAALQTVELLLDVFSYLDHVDLAVVARTCSDFLEPALTYLWRYLAVLGPIVRLLPDERLSIDLGQNRSWTRSEGFRYQITGRPSDDDVARVRYYAGFVKSFKFWQYIVDISADDLQKVLIALRGEPLFPNLRTFEYIGPSDFTPLLLAFIGTSLTTLKMYYSFDCNFGAASWEVRPEDVDYTVDRDALLAIKKRKSWAPITKLSICTNLAFPDFLRPVLAGWDELEELALGSHVDIPLLMEIGRLPRLRVLSVAAPDGIVDHPLTSQSSCPHNYTLTSLRLGGNTATEILSVLRPASLSDIRLDGEMSASVFRAICLHLREFSVSASLQRMSLHQAAVMPFSDASKPYWSEPLLIQHIQPMFFYSNLLCVSLVFHTIALTDSEIYRIAQSWPHLQELNIMQASPADPLCTLSSLLAFAQYCPDLVTLHIPLDATRFAIPDPTDVSSPRAHRSLHTLYVANSPISSPERVASFLTRFFPNLSAKGLIVYPRDEGRKRLWSVVQRLIPVLLDARVIGIHGGVKPA